MEQRCDPTPGWQPPFARPRSEELPMTNTWETEDGRWLNTFMPTFMFARSCQGDIQLSPQ